MGVEVNKQMKPIERLLWVLHSLVTYNTVLELQMGLDVFKLWHKSKGLCCYLGTRQHGLSYMGYPVRPNPYLHPMQVLGVTAEEALFDKWKMDPAHGMRVMGTLAGRKSSVSKVCDS